MNRRTLLHRGGIGVAGLVALSGCTEETLEEAETRPPFLDVDAEELDLPVDQRVDVVEDGVLRAEEATIEEVDDFEGYLEELDVAVEELAEEEKPIEEQLDVEREDAEDVEEEAHGEGLVLALEFVQPERLEGGVLDTIGLVAGGYAALVDAGYDAEKLEATVLDPEGSSFGSFDVLTSWADEYNEGITTARVYGSKPWMSAKSE